MLLSNLDPTKPTVLTSTLKFKTKNQRKEGAKRHYNH